MSGPPPQPNPPASSVQLPTWKDLLWPTLEAIKELGGSGTIQEIEAKVAPLLQLTEDRQAVLHKDGPDTEVNYRLAWARTYLKGVGALTNSSRGVWAITDLGHQMTEADMAGVEAKYRAVRKATGGDPRRRRGIDREDLDREPVEIDRDWKAALLNTILELPPDRFEHLAKRLLREAGFVQVTVTGGGGDEGIDGTGIYRQALVSFPVYFQCKRYKGTVPPSAVREFRGAIQGRGEKGLLITTGSFTAQAQSEASRPGAPLVDLIDGDTLADLLKQYRLGVKVVEKVVEDVEVDPEFFKTV
jgi:restriction system protein